MSLLFDQNLSRRLPGMLATEFPHSEHVLLLGLSTVDDETIWQYAASRRLTIVSKDADFVRLATTVGAPPKVIWFRIGNGPTSEIVALMQQRVPVVQAFLADPDTALLTLP